MSALQQLSVIALHQLVSGVIKATGFESAEAIARFLFDRFSDHSQTLTRALSVANARAWTSLEVALAGDSLWERLTRPLSRAEDLAFRQQVQALLDSTPLAKVKAEQRGLLIKARKELAEARAAGLLTGPLAVTTLSQQVAGFARFADAEAVYKAEWELIHSMAREFAAYPTLAQIVKAPLKQGNPSLLAVAMRYHFRRQVEQNEELFRGLAFAKLEALQQAQGAAYANFTEALATLGDSIDSVFATLERIEQTVEDTNERVRGIEASMQTLLAQVQMLHRELRPSDSLSLRSAADQEAVARLAKDYRGLPQEARDKRPDLLNNLGKLEVAAGEYESAQRDFEAAARLAKEDSARAEAYHNAYRAALERQQWDEALKALRQAYELDAGRFAPFDVKRYTPERILGAGGFGVVFLCKKRNLPKPVVVKSLLAAELDRSIDDVIQEASALQLLEHPGIIRVTDCNTDHAHPFIEMDYFDGMNLAEYVEKHGPLSPTELLPIARQVAEALKAAHAHGILHRDVKPANLLVRRGTSGSPASGDWSVKLIDFGLAMRPDTLNAKASSQQAKTTIGRSIAGTVHYAAPEQMGIQPGVTVGTYSDVYGFGRTCYFALLKTSVPDPVEADRMPCGWREFLIRCTRNSAGERLADFTAVLAELANLSVETQPDVDQTAQQGENDTLQPENEGTEEKQPEEGTDSTPGPESPTTDPLAEGIACLGRGDFVQAVKKFNEAKKLTPNNPEVYRHRAEAHRLRGHHEKALADLDILLQLEPKVAANRYARGLTFAAMGKHDRAISEFDKAILNGWRNSAVYIARGQSHAANGGVLLAIADFDQALALSPNDAEIHACRAEVRLGQEAFELALADFQEATRLRPEMGKYLCGVGRILMRQCKTEEALQVFIQAVQRDPHCAEAYLHRADLWRAQGNDKQAEADYTRVIDFDPKCVLAIAGRAFVRAKMGRAAQSIRDFDRAINLNDRDHELYLGRAWAKYERQDFNEASKDFTEALKGKRDAAGYLGRASAYLALNYLGSAIADFTASLQLQPGQIDALDGRAYALWKKKRYDEAIIDADEVIRLDPTRVRAYEVRGCCRREKHEVALAVADLSEAMRLMPKNAPLSFARGVAYYQSGDYSNAVLDFTAAINLDTENQELLRYRASAYEKLGDKEKAREDRARATALTAPPPPPQEEAEPQ